MQNNLKLTPTGRISANKKDTALQAKRWTELKGYFDHLEDNHSDKGRPKAISTPGELWNHCLDYFEWCDSNPWVKIDFKGKDAARVALPNARPYTWAGLDAYLFKHAGLTKLEDYKANRSDDTGAKPYAAFSEVITRVRKIMEAQKLEGAMVGAFDSRIVAADLKLSQKVEIEMPEQIMVIAGQKIIIPGSS